MIKITITVTLALVLLLAYFQPVVEARRGGGGRARGGARVVVSAAIAAKAMSGPSRSKQQHGRIVSGKMYYGEGVNIPETNAQVESKPAPGTSNNAFRLAFIIGIIGLLIIAALFIICKVCCSNYCLRGSSKDTNDPEKAPLEEHQSDTESDADSIKKPPIEWYEDESKEGEEETTEKTPLVGPVVVAPNNDSASDRTTSDSGGSPPPPYEGDALPNKSSEEIEAAPLIEKEETQPVHASQPVDEQNDPYSLPRNASPTMPVLAMVHHSSEEEIKQDEQDQSNKPKPTKVVKFAPTVSNPSSTSSSEDELDKQCRRESRMDIPPAYSVIHDVGEGEDQSSPPRADSEPSLSSLSSDSEPEEQEVTGATPDERLSDKEQSPEPDEAITSDFENEAPAIIAESEHSSNSTSEEDQPKVNPEPINADEEMGKPSNSDDLMNSDSEETPVAIEGEPQTRPSSSSSSSDEEAITVPPEKLISKDDEKKSDSEEDQPVIVAPEQNNSDENEQKSSPELTDDEEHLDEPLMETKADNKQDQSSGSLHSSSSSSSSEEEATSSTDDYQMMKNKKKHKRKKPAVAVSPNTDANSSNAENETGKERDSDNESDLSNDTSDNDDDKMHDYSNAVTLPRRGSSNNQSEEG